VRGLRFVETFAQAEGARQEEERRTHNQANGHHCRAQREACANYSYDWPAGDLADWIHHSIEREDGRTLIRVGNLCHPGVDKWYTHGAHRRRAQEAEQSQGEIAGQTKEHNPKHQHDLDTQERAQHKSRLAGIHFALHELSCRQGQERAGHANEPDHSDRTHAPEMRQGEILQKMSRLKAVKALAGQTPEKRCA
jgi:hypothetical protein